TLPPIAARSPPLPPPRIVEQKARPQNSFAHGVLFGGGLASLILLVGIGAFLAGRSGGRIELPDPVKSTESQQFLADAAPAAIAVDPAPRPSPPDEESDLATAAPVVPPQGRTGATETADMSDRDGTLVELIESV